MDPVVSVQDKNFSENTTELAKILGAEQGSLKSFTLTIPWNSDKLVKIFPGIIVRPHQTDQKQMGLLKEQCASQSSLNEIGGQIPWNAIRICETFKISGLMGRPHTKGALENRLKDQSFRLVHWFSITL